MTTKKTITRRSLLSWAMGLFLMSPISILGFSKGNKTPVQTHPVDFESLVDSATYRVLNPTIDTETMPEMFQNHEGQKLAWNSYYRYIAIFAGWQSGKSSIGAPWLVREIQRCGPGDYAVITPSFPLLQNKALPELLKAFNGIATHLKSENVLLITPEGSMALWGYVAECRILLRHGDRPEAIEAFTAKALWLDEPGQISDEVWESIQARVAVEQGRILFTSRPYAHNWYVTQLWKRCMDSNNKRKPDADPMIDIINFRSIDNPAFPVEEYNRQKRILPAWKFAMKYDGIPERPSGAIYDCYDEVYNTCKRFPVPQEWPLYVGVDFGPINTAAVILAAELSQETWGWGERTGRYYVIGEYHAGEKRTAAKHIEAVRDVAFKSSDGQPLPPIGYGGASAEEGWRESWTYAGLPLMIPPDNNVEHQIQCVWTAMNRRIQGGQHPGLSQIVFFDDLTGILGEVTSYTREVDENGDATDKIADKSKYHLLDSLRYVGASVFVMPSTMETGIRDIRKKEKDSFEVQLESIMGRLFKNGKR